MIGALLAASVLFASVEGACKKRYSRKWPHCDNVGCYRASLAWMDQRCSTNSRCNGFSYSAGTTNGWGCLKYDCVGAREGRRGYGHGSHDYWDCSTTNPLNLPVATRTNQRYTPEWNRMLTIANTRDCYVFSIDAGTMQRHFKGMIEPEVGGYICDDGNGRITNGEFGYTIGGCFKYIGNRASIVNGKFRMNVLDVTVDVCTLASFGVGKAITAVARKMIAKSVAYGVKRSGSSWAQRKYATAQQYGKLPDSSMKSWAARNAGDYLYASALHSATAPVRPPLGDCQAMYKALMNLHNTKFCIIRKVAAATGNHALRSAVNGIAQFQRTLGTALRYLPIEELLPKSNVGVKLDMQIDVNTFDTSLYMSFHVYLAMFSQQKAAAAVASKLGQSCTTVSRNVCNKVASWVPWVGRTIKWVCKRVNDVVCKPFQLTASTLRRIPDITDYMPKLRYQSSNMRVAHVPLGRTVNFIRMPSRRDLTRRRRLEGEDVDDEENFDEFMGGSEDGDENSIVRSLMDRIFDEESSDSEADRIFNTTVLEADIDEDLKPSVNASDIDIDAEISEICATKTTASECEKMSEDCVWSEKSDGCVSLGEEETGDDDELIEAESRKILDSGKRGQVVDPSEENEVKRGRKDKKRDERAAEIDRKQFDRKLKKLGRALRRANCDLEFGFLGGPSDVWTNEKYAAPGTSGDDEISSEMIDMVDAVIELIGSWNIKGLTKCRRLERLAVKLADAHDGRFELRVGGAVKNVSDESSEDDNNLRRRLDSELDVPPEGPISGVIMDSLPDGAMMDMRLYECAIQWHLLSASFQELCSQRFAALNEF